MMLDDHPACFARRIKLSCVLLAVVIGWPGKALRGQEPTPRVEKTDLYGDPLPSGAIARLGTTRFRHGSPLLSGLMFLPDSTTLVHLADRSIRFCDALSGRLVKELPRGSFNVAGMALSPDGRLIALAGFTIPEDATPTQGEVRLLEIASGQTLRTLPRGDRETDAHALTFTPDGKLLVSLSGRSGTLRIEEVATGTEILQQRFPADNSSSLALTPDGSTLAISTGPNTGKFYLWKWASGEEPQELVVSGNRRPYARLTFSPDGKQLAACGDFRSPLRVWDVESGRVVQDLALPDDRKEYVRGSAVYTPDGQSLLAPGYRRDRGNPVAFHWWDATTGAYQGRLDAEGGNPLAISTDGRLLAAGAGVGLRVWRWPSREEVLPNDEAHRGSVGCLAIAPDATVVTASDDGTIRLWDPVTGKQQRKLQHDHWVRDIALSPDGTRLVSSSLDDTVRLWDPATGREIYRLPGHGRLGGRRAVAFSADGRSFASFGDDYHLRIWDAQTGKALVEHKLQPTGVKVPAEGEFNEFLDLSEARFSSDASLLILGFGKFFVFDVKTGRELKILDHEAGSFGSLTFSPDSRRLLAAGTGRSVQTTLPDGRVRHSPAKSYTITLWDLASWQIVKQLTLSGGSVGPVAFSVDGLRFAVATHRPDVRIAIYDTASGAEQHIIEGLPSRVASLAFAPDGRTLVSGLGDSTALVWDLIK